VSYDGIVIGGGAAGLYAAAWAARKGSRILLIEKNDRLGKKLLITGKGRCNVTNNCTAQQVLANVPRNGRFLFSAMEAHPPKDVMSFFEELGCMLKTERGDRVFPVTDKSQSVLDALKLACKKAGVTMQTGAVREIIAYDGAVKGVRLDSGIIDCKWAILATGGLSYPTTGSTGDGYIFADRLGHTIEEVRPSLTPLRTSHPQRKFLDGLLLKNVNAKLYVEDEMVREEFGELSFSDRGIEGAVALRVSRDAVDALIEEKRVKMVIDLKPALTEEILEERIRREIAEMQPDEFFSELLRKLVPKHFVLPIAHELDIHSKNYIRKVTDAEIKRLVKVLKGMVFPITDYAPFEYAVVTAGGVRCDEVNKYTMESLKVKGLYFAGEVLDIDANTGGYNLQIAFSTGRLAGQLKK
jgi:predicted Rossmann fold flavoprotein